MPRTFRFTRGLRTTAAAAVLGASLALSGCGFDVQTLHPYTPAHGVNIDSGNLKLRNVLIVANDGGQGVLSGSIVSADKADSLTDVSGTAQQPDGKQAGTFKGTANVQLPANKLVVLTDGEKINLSSPELKPGMLARVKLTFGSGATHDLEVPVLSAEDPIYATLAPKGGSQSAKPSSSASPQAGDKASPSASPTHE